MEIITTFLPIIIWTVLTLIPLVPTYILHRFLESSATFTNTSRGIKLGGAIAAYFILLTTGGFMYHQLVEPTLPDPLSETRTSLVGEWSCTAIIRDSDNEEAIGSTIPDNMMLIIDNNRQLSINGSTGMMTWNADVVVLNYERMVFIFEVPIDRISGTTFLRFVRNGTTITQMHGHWGITGDRGTGNLSCTRPTTG